MTYHLTGEERYLKLAEGMAEHILRARAGRLDLARL